MVPEAGYTLDRPPIHHRAEKQRHPHLRTILETPVNLTGMSLAGGESQHRNPTRKGTWLSQESPNLTHVLTLLISSIIIQAKINSIILSKACVTETELVLNAMGSGFMFNRGFVQLSLYYSVSIAAK